MINIEKLERVMGISYIVAVVIIVVLIIIVYKDRGFENDK